MSKPSRYAGLARCSFEDDLLLAIRRNDTDEVKHILDQGCDVDVHLSPEDYEKPVGSYCIYGEPAVCYCIQVENYEMAKLFVERRCDLRLTASNGMSPLQLAVLHGSEKFVEYLIQKKAKINDRNGYSQNPLHIACTTSCSNSMPIVRKLCEKNAELNITDVEGRTPLILACYHGLKDVAMYLIGKGAQVNIVDRRGSSALVYAVSRSHYPVLVDALLEHGAQIRDGNRDFQLPKVFLESMKIPEYKLKGNELDNMRILQSLFNAGCYVNTPEDSVHQTVHQNALHLAATSKQALLVKTVLNAGCPVSIADSLGNTGLFYACRSKDKASVELILAAGIDRQLETEWLRKFNFCNDEILRICLTKLTRPLTLKERCRLSIRQTAAPNIEQGVRSLQIPNVLKDFLLFNY